jgi:hypothetical protein
MFQFALGEQGAIDEKTLARFLEVYGGIFDRAVLFEWFRRNGAYYIDAPTWMRALNRFDLVLGPRYHGIALAIQAGIPGTVVTMDGRTQELCEGTAIKAIDIEQALAMSADELCENAKWTLQDAQQFDANRSVKAALLQDFLLSNGLQPSEHLRTLA